jgi:hypothetical protein
MAFVLNAPLKLLSDETPVVNDEEFMIARNPTGRVVIRIHDRDGMPQEVYYEGFADKAKLESDLIAKAPGRKRVIAAALKAID